jgi:hypothetical protein
MSDLPAATTTFLFTDIEGSTVLWERDRQAMGEAVERYLHHLGATVEAPGSILETKHEMESRLGSYCAGRSARVTETSSCSSPRWTVTGIVSPGWN